MKLDVNKESVLRLVAGDQLYKIYKGNEKELSKASRQANYDAKGINKKARGATKDQLKAAIAYAIYGRSLQLCPEDTGYLKETSHLRPFKNGYEIMYKAPYATYVHEIPYYNHEYPTRYKFLEDAAVEIGTQYIKDKNYKVDLRINYNPLAVYVGCNTTLGESLWAIQDRENDRDNKGFDTWVYRKYMEDDDEALESVLGESDYMFLYMYIDYWQSWNEQYHRDVDDAELVMDWVERIRHEGRVPRDKDQRALQYNMFINNRNSYM